MKWFSIFCRTGFLTSGFLMLTAFSNVPIPTSGDVARAEYEAEDSIDTSGPVASLQDALQNSRNLSRACQRDFVRNTRFKNPKSSQAMKLDLDEYIRIGRKAGISESQMRQTLAVYVKNQAYLGNQRYLSIIDYSKKSDQKRMHILDLTTGKIESVYTTHGKGSDPRGSGRGKVFSNKSGSHASSLGCMVTGGTYQGGRGLSMILHGIEPGKNDRACGRSVVIHAANYVGNVPGRSWGCPAVRRSDRQKVFDRLQKGALICAFNGDKK